MSESLDHLLEKLCKCEQEISDLNHRQLNAKRRHHYALELLKLLVVASTQAANFAAEAAEKSLIATEYLSLINNDNVDIHSYDIPNLAKEAVKATQVASDLTKSLSNALEKAMEINRSESSA